MPSAVLPELGQFSWEAFAHPAAPFEPEVPETSFFFVFRSHTQCGPCPLYGSGKTITVSVAFGHMHVARRRLVLTTVLPTVYTPL